MSIRLIDFTNAVDESAEVIEGENSDKHGKSLDFQLWLSDEEYKEIFSRSDLEHKKKYTFDYLLKETETTFEAMADLYEDGTVKLLLVVQDDENGWEDAYVPLEESEEKTLIKDIERVKEKRGIDIKDYFSEQEG